MKKIYSFALALLCVPALLLAQKPAKPSGADLHQAIKKLNVLGSVLYVAAHPDDENQRFISYCANQRYYEVTYLSLTRGDGGQNLIGPEIRELLGVLRTEELLMARSVDGGKQRFSRANDFGFSKNPEETLRIWDKDAVLSDVVWAMRETQPDVVVNRFMNDRKAETHGHHTASALLSVEAFDLAGNKDAYPEQLKYTTLWQPRRQFFNTSWWFYGSQENFDKQDKSNLYPLDLGVFLPLKGKSNNELAAEARSMHRCQGFGSLSSRGENIEWFNLIKGDTPPEKDPFAGINTTWTRVAGGEKIGKLLAKIDQNYRSDNPSASVPDLLKAMEMIKALPESHWKQIKLPAIKEVIRGCLGLYLEATATEATSTPGQPVKVHLEAINRSAQSVQLAGFSLNPALFDTIVAQSMADNKLFKFDKVVTIGENAGLTAPYWLLKPFSPGIYTVEDQQLRGQPESPRYASVRWSFTINGIAIEFDTDVAYKVEENAIGEVWRPFEVLPPVFVEFEQPSYLFTQKEGSVTVKVKAGQDNVQGTVLATGPGNGWITRGAPQSFDFKKKGEEKSFTFTIESGRGEASLTAFVRIANKVYDKRLVTINYEHIPQQSILLPATAHAAQTEVAVKAKNIGYFMGAGDEVPNALRQIGCTVTMLEDKDFTADNLQKFDAIVLGIRAYNTKISLATHQTQLLDYVQNGGTLIAQYNTNSDLVLDKITALPLKISRTRVTDENAEMRFRLPEHPALNTPNKLTADDFAGWVQERGLYFPSEWDAAYEAPLSCNDPNEKPADGALLIAPYGKGYYVYTGLSFFRELPAGVPGAYRLFANLISIGKK